MLIMSIPQRNQIHNFLKKLSLFVIFISLFKFFLLFKYLKTFSFQHLPQTGNHDCCLITRQYKFNLMAQFNERNSNNPTLKQSEIAKKLNISSSGLQRHRNDISMFSTYRIPAKSNKGTKDFKSQTWFRKTSNDLKWPQTTPNDLKRYKSKC